MAHAPPASLQRAFRALLAGFLTFIVLVTLASVHGALTGLSVPQLITAWAEWFSALVLFPYAFSFGALGRWGEERGHRLVTLGWQVALEVFALDLLMRAVLGLGWEPYFI